MHHGSFFNRSGQVLVLYALLIPTLIICLGAGLDLGWYYLKVSRLQNAADAAALAGAHALADRSREAFGELYYVVALKNNDIPDYWDDYENVFKHNFGTLQNYKEVAAINNELMYGRDTVEEYVRKNLSDASATATLSDSWKSADATDGYNDEQVTGTVELKYQLVDGKNDNHGSLYYVVSLSEDIQHLFMPGWFEDMHADVRAVVLLDPHDNDLVMAMEKLQKTEVIDNWQYQNKFKGQQGVYDGKWNHYKAGTTANDSGVMYTDGKTYRTESLSVKSTESYKDGGQKTEANGNKFYAWNEVDSLNLDFQAELRYNFQSDWDLGLKGVNITKYAHIDKRGKWSKDNGADKRILYNAEFDDVFKTRYPASLADPLWTRIESDPIISFSYLGIDSIAFNSVRQITLNFNKDNTARYPEGNEHEGHYMYRPYVIFYDGPEHIDYATDANGVLIRRSQPVVINLNADLNAIFYMPESPVVINGNGHDWTGFIIAKCFLAAVTAEDLTNGSSFELNDGFHAPTTFAGNCIEVVDSYGNTLYVKREDLLDSQTVNKKFKACTKTEDTTTGTVTFNYAEGYSTGTEAEDELKGGNHIIVSFKKDDFNFLKDEDVYKTKSPESLEHYHAATNRIFNDSYKEKFKAFTGLTDDEITSITFPDENGKDTGLIVWVAKDDLLEFDPDPDAAVKDDKYVKVISDGKDRFINKSLLPYVKIRRNGNYPYVCLYDLKTAWINTEDASVRIVDDSINVSGKDAKADVYINPYDTNPTTTYNNSWGVNRWYLENIYDKQYTANQVTVAAKDGIGYFVKKSTATFKVASYRRVTNSKGEEFFLKDDTKYYMKAFNNASDKNAYIIVDQNGNMLTKTLPANSTRPTNDDEQPIDTQRIADRSLEVVYVDPTDKSKPPFGLSNVSYSSFGIESLIRRVYRYLDSGSDVVDMFFTTARAEWID
ncbi:MAG: hypothetical protein SR2Q5_07320 [Quinella sp. 2Q5]|nr:hypothetical protein [Quinella sp. 2Q5]